jgi:hypothetical protein
MNYKYKTDHEHKVTIAVKTEKTLHLFSDEDLKYRTLHCMFSHT